MLSTIFVTTVLIACLVLAYRQGLDTRDRMTSMGLRLVLLSFVFVLFFSPRFETIHKSWEKPRFLVLEDDSESVKSASSKSFPKKWLEELSSVAQVDRMSFSQTEAEQIYSIASQLELANQSQEPYRALFLRSDGQEISSRKANSKFPLFLLPVETTASRDLQLSLDVSPQLGFRGEKVRLDARVLQQGAQGETVRVVLFQDQELQSQKEVLLENEQNPVSLDFELKDLGVQRFRLEVDSLEQERSLTNNRIEFYTEVFEKKRKIAVMAHKPSRDLGMYLEFIDSDSSFAPLVHYSKLRIHNQTLQKICATDDVQLVLLYEMSTQILEECESWSKVPVLQVVNPESLLAEELHGQFLAQDLRQSLGGRLSYKRIDPDFTPLRVFELEAFEKSVFATLPILENTLKRTRIIPPGRAVFGLVAENEVHPLLSVHEEEENPRAILYSNELYKLILHPYMRNEHRMFLQGMILNLAHWMVQYKETQGLKTYLPATNLLEGETFQFEASSKTRSHARLSSLDSEGSPVIQGYLPVQWKVELKRGNYALQVYNGSKPVFKKFIRVGLDPLEFRYREVGLNGLKELAQQSSGRVLEENEERLLPYLSGKILEKKLELKKERVDVQKNTWLAILLLLLLCAEWVVRFYRRLI